MVVVLHHVAFVEIDGFAGQRIQRNHFHSAGGSLELFEIQRVFPAFFRKVAVNVIKVQIRTGVEQGVQAHVFLPEGILHVKLIIPAFLLRKIGGNIGTSCGNADTVVKLNIVVQTVVKNAGAVNSPEPAAHVHNSRH